MQPAAANQPTPQQVFEEAHRMLRVGDVFEAARRAGTLRRHFPDDAPILTLHGMVLAKMGVHPQALSDLIKAAQLTERRLDEEAENPARPRIVDQLIRLSVQICRSSLAIGELAAAEEAIENALKWDPDRGDAVAAKAELLSAKGKPGDGLKLIEKAQQEQLEELPLVLSKARILLSMSAVDDETLSAVETELEEQVKGSGLAAIDLGDLLRAAGMINDRLGKHDDAFNAFRRAAKLRRVNYDPRTYTMMTTKVIHDWSAANMAKLVRPEQSGEAFVLVLGSPHSGAEQLARMLGQLDGAAVVGPLETLSGVCIRHLGAKQGVLRPVPLEPQKLRGAQLRDGGAAYAAQVQAIAGEGARRMIDTHPLNIPHAGAAALMLPGVHIVMCRRDPVESTLACYCDAMIGNHPYASDVLNAAGFVADSNRMLDHWAQVLADESVGANVVEVQYSELVADPKAAAVRVAGAIGLDANTDAIDSTPEFTGGPGDHPEDYKNYMKQAMDLLGPAAQS